MRVVLGIFIAVLLCVPGIARAGDEVKQTDDGSQIALLSPDLGHTIESHNKNDSGKIEKSTAAKEKIAPGLKDFLNRKRLTGGKHSTSSKCASLYASPRDVLHINPFFSDGAKGISAEVRW